jgi:methenyltetrahydromethanopterin cyclohydrolase
MPSTGPQPSVNAGAAFLVDQLVASASSLRCTVSTGAAGERLIDLGAQATGGLEAGRRLAEICMGGLGTVSLTTASGHERWPLGVVVHSTNPVLACLASQYGGWHMSDEATGFFALGSGPARALAHKEPLFKELAYADRHPKATLVIEGDKAPPSNLAASVAADCGVAPADLTILFAPTGSLAGGTQVVSRVLEVALHKAHTLHFPLDHIVDGVGTAPLSPPHPDFVTAMGRTNDAIIYGGRVQLFVRGTNEAAEKLAAELPSKGSPAYGQPFAEIFSAVNGDFYKIDPMLFSPAAVTVTNIDTGRSFHGGGLAPAIVDRSFG